ncbi:hypothetical protein KXV85_006016, partial [Aspergillus fumigatus]
RRARRPVRPVSHHMGDRGQFRRSPTPRTAQNPDTDGRRSGAGRGDEGADRRRGQGGFHRGRWRKPADRGGAQSEAGGAGGRAIGAGQTRSGRCQGQQRAPCAGGQQAGGRSGDDVCEFGQGRGQPRSGQCTRRHARPNRPAQPYPGA